MEKLIAKSSILFESHIYAPGDELPRHDAAMEKAWLDAGTAIVKPDETAKAPEKVEPTDSGAKAETEEEKPKKAKTTKTKAAKE